MAQSACGWRSDVACSCTLNRNRETQRRHPPRCLAEGVQVIPQECAQARTAEQSVNIPVPLIKEDIAEGVQVIPQERVRARIAEQRVNTPKSRMERGAPPVLTREEPAGKCEILADAKC